MLIFLISTHLQNEEADKGMGVVLLLVTILARFFRSFYESHAQYELLVLGNDISSILALAMVSKSMRFSLLCNKQFKIS